MRHTAISKLLGTTVGVKIKNTTVVGLLVGIAKAITRTKIDEIAKKLKPYGIIIP